MPKALPLLALVVTSVVLAGCGGSSPTSPTKTAAVAVTYSPSPVAWSAGPGVSATCVASANVWKFSILFAETGGVAVTLNSVVATIDGAAQPAQTVSVAVPASGSFTNSTAEICFATSTQHTLQHRFTGTDSKGAAVSATGPVLNLSAR